MKKYPIVVRIVPSETLNHEALLLGFYAEGEFITTRVCANNTKAAEEEVINGLNQIYGRLHISGKIKFGTELQAVVERGYAVEGTTEPTPDGD
jgi:hypothetical protein